jgi:hypothetical protein
VHAVVPAALDVHLVIDNYGTHKHAKVRAWLAKRPRFHVHYTPTYASWRDQIERWFGILSQREIRRGSFTSSKSSWAASTPSWPTTTTAHNPSAGPATADEILGKVARIWKLIKGTRY